VFYRTTMAPKPADGNSGPKPPHIHTAPKHLVDCSNSEASSTAHHAIMAQTQARLGAGKCYICAHTSGLQPGISIPLVFPRGEEPKRGILLYLCTRIRPSASLDRPLFGHVGNGERAAEMRGMYRAAEMRAGVYRTAEIE
jgi:hypothetical protein